MIAALWQRFSGWVVAVAAILAGVWYAWGRGRASAQHEAQVRAESDRAQRNAQAAQDIQNAAEERNHVEADIARRPGRAADRLRDNWSED